MKLRDLRKHRSRRSEDAVRIRSMRLVVAQRVPLLHICSLKLVNDLARVGHLPSPELPSDQERQRQDRSWPLQLEPRPVIDPSLIERGPRPTRRAARPRPPGAGARRLLQQTLTRTVSDGRVGSHRGDRSQGRRRTG